MGAVEKGLGSRTESRLAFLTLLSARQLAGDRKADVDSRSYRSNFARDNSVVGFIGSAAKGDGNNRGFCWPTSAALL
jgi:hypothetical protein